MTTPIDLHERIEAAAVAVLPRIGPRPTVALVLGSGLGVLADALEHPRIVPYGQIPGFPSTTVAGHAGNLIVGDLAGVRVAAFQGRFHHYEGHELATTTFPIRLAARLGARTLILTAATGGIAPGLGPGSLVVLSDHLNLIGSNPLRGPNDDRLGPRFPDMTAVYSARLRKIAIEQASTLGIDLREGVYACLPGPSYETPAEIRMLRALGADVVGMSTVPEAIVARHSGMEVLAFAVVSNAAAGLGGQPITHAEVLQEGKNVGGRLAGLIRDLVGPITAQQSDHPGPGPAGFEPAAVHPPALDRTMPR